MSQYFIDKALQNKQSEWQREFNSIYKKGCTPGCGGVFTIPDAPEEKEEKKPFIDKQVRYLYGRGVIKDADRD